MKFNLKYLLLPLSIMVCISGNYSNAMETEDEEEINTNSNIINTNSNVTNTNNNITDTDSYQHIFDENYNKEYYDEVCNKCIEYIARYKPQYKTFIESSFIAFNKLIEIATEKYKHFFIIEFDYDNKNDIKDDSDSEDDSEDMKDIIVDDLENITQIARLSDSFNFKNNDLLKKLKMQGNKLSNNNFQQLNNWINNAKGIKKESFSINNDYILNLLNKLKAQCIVKLTDSINNGENYRTQIDIIKDTQQIIDSIIMRSQDNYYTGNFYSLPNYYYEPDNESCIFDRLYYNDSKLENRFNNLHNKIISTLEEIINNHNSNNTFVTINKENLNKLIDKVFTKNEKLYDFVQTGEQKLIKFDTIISTLQNTEQLTTKQYYKYITDILTKLKDITDNQVQNRLKHHYTQVIFNNNEEYEDIISYYLSIAYLLLDCGHNKDCNNNNCQNAMLDIVSYFARKYNINFNFQTKRYYMNGYFNESFYYNRRITTSTKYEVIPNMHKILQMTITRILDNKEGNFSNMQLYEKLLETISKPLLCQAKWSTSFENTSLYNELWKGIKKYFDFSMHEVIDYILLQFTKILHDNIYEKDFPCEAAFILYYKIMINRIIRTIFINEKCNNKKTCYQLYSEYSSFFLYNYKDCFTYDYKNSIWYDTAMKLFNNQEDFLAASNIETIVNNIQNNTTLGNNPNNNTQNTLDNLISFIIMICSDKIITEQEAISLLQSLLHDASNVKNMLNNMHTDGNLNNLISQNDTENRLIEKIEDPQTLNSLLYFHLNYFISFYSNNFNNVLPNNTDDDNIKNITNFVNNYILGGKTENTGTNLQKDNYKAHMRIINTILNKLVEMKCKNIFKKYKNKKFSKLSQIDKTIIDGNERELYKDCLKEVYDLFSFINIASHKILYKKYGVHANNQQIFNNNNRLGNMSNSDLLIRFYNTFDIGEKFTESFERIIEEQKTNNKLLTKAQIENNEKLKKLINNFFFQDNDSEVRAGKTFVNFIYGYHHKEKTIQKVEEAEKIQEMTDPKTQNTRSNILPRIAQNPYCEITKYL